MIQKLTNLNDFSKIIDNNKKVLIDFFATWCGPCKMFAPMLNKVASKNQDWFILEIDIDQFKELSMQYNVSAVPTLIFIKDGKTVNASTGYMPDSEIQKIMDKI